jgi:hypothetical protein
MGLAANGEWGVQATILANAPIPISAIALETRKEYTLVPMS